jgi:acyl carrier protein
VKEKVDDSIGLVGQPLPGVGRLDPSEEEAVGDAHQRAGGVGDGVAAQLAPVLWSAGEFGCVPEMTRMTVNTVMATQTLTLIVRNRRADFLRARKPPRGNRRDDAATDGVAVFVQHRGSLADFAPVVNRIKAVVWDSAGLEVSDVVPVQSLPKTTSGKIRRFALRESFGRGTYDETLRALRAMARTAGSESRLMLSVIERTLKDICESVIRGRHIGVNDSLIDGGADSLALAEIQVAIDAVYPSLISIEDFLDYPTIAALALFVESKLATASDHADASQAVHQS